MAETVLIDLIDMPGRWQKLMLKLSNQPETVIRCRFPDEKTAREGAHRMREAVNRQPSWFNLLVAVRGADVFVVKLNKASKVVVRT